MSHNLNFDYKPLKWIESAECKKPGIDPNWFFPDNENIDFVQIKAALNVCRDCTVKQQCFEYAMEKWPVYGIWGGHRNTDLRAIAKKRKIA